MASRRVSLLLLLGILCLSSSHGTLYTVTDQVYLDVSIGGELADRIVLGLFGEIAPKTVRNFLAFAKNGVNGYTYKGASFHRVIRRFMIQSGDVVKHDGTGSISLYGNYFPDETFHVRHSAPGIVSMANSGKDTNGCQFFITTVPTPWLDNLHVAFGKVVQGMAAVHKIENTATDTDDRPLRPVVIEDVGILPTPQTFTVSDEPYDIWEWIRSASVPLAFSFCILAFFHWMIRQLDIATADEPEIVRVKTNTPLPKTSPIEDKGDAHSEQEETSKEPSDDDITVRKRKTVS